ncbi:MAG: hypothetical protein ACR2PI_15455 [Hyphomicrobiaceae bacterium]
MVNMITSNHSTYIPQSVPAESPVTTAPTADPLSDHRVEQGRQWALAASQADHAHKVQSAIEAYMNFEADQAIVPSATVAQAQQSYGEF